MKSKIHLKNFIIYNVLLIIMISVFYKIGIIDNIIRYIKYETAVLEFQDLLSITITILSIL